MFDSFWQALQGLGSPEMAEFGLVPLLAVLLVAMASSLFIAWLYRVFYRSRATGSEVYRAFPLMGISITAIFISVQFSLPLSLGLLGALSIVRFRTPIKEPEEIGFILLVIACSLAAATFNLAFLGLILGAAVAALLVLRSRGGFLAGGTADGTVVVVLPAAVSSRLDDLLGTLHRELPRGNVDSVAHDDDVTVAYRFSGLDARRVPDLVATVRAVADGTRPSVFFHRSGDV